jgi:RNA-binding protein NOB1
MSDNTNTLTNETTNAWSSPLQVEPEAPDNHEAVFHSPTFKAQQDQRESSTSSSSSTKTSSNNFNGLLTSEASKLSLQVDKKIVIDSGAVIRGAKLEKYGSEFYTTPLVLSEIKSSKSRTRLLMFPFEIKVKQPTEEAMSIVSSYAQKTGDYAGLSKTDLSVIALTYQLEVELHGKKNIKPEPDSLGINGYKKVQLTPYPDILKRNDPEKYRIHEMDDQEENEAEEQDGEDSEQQEEQHEHTHGDSCDHHHHAETEEDGDDDWHVPSKAVRVRKGANGIRVKHEVQEAPEESEDEDIEEGDEYGEWITKDNLHLHRGINKENQSESWDQKEPEPIQQPEEEQESTTEQPAPAVESTTEENKESPPTIEPSDDRKVGCMTVDFAMQNVLLHMGLNLITFDGRRIKHLTRYVNRCYACSTLVPDVRRIFCPNCGNQTLKKVSATINEQGEAVFYYNPKRRINLRGTKYTIPLPKGGRKGKDPVLREDQLAMFKYGKPHKSKLNLGKQKSDSGTEIWNPEYSFENLFNGNSSRHPTKHRSANLPYNGFGRRNPNESVNTGAHKKKKQNR